MIISIDLSQEIFAIDILQAIKSSLKHRQKHVLRWLQPYGDHAGYSVSSICSKHYDSDTTISKEVAAFLGLMYYEHYWTKMVTLDKALQNRLNVRSEMLLERFRNHTLKTTTT